MEWISIIDKQPELGEVCFIYVPGFYHTGIQKTVDFDLGIWNGTEFLWLLTGFYEKVTITHWMPMLKLPEGE